ncbi:hypothetical protein BH23GEM7_BH23GEM7_03320 [soil metagenome]|jgi:outer membrane protein assembly factor BamD
MNRFSVRYRRFLLALAGLALLSGCGTRQPRLAQLGPDALYEQGMAAYEARRHARAIELLERFAQQHLGDERMPQARITLGRSYMARREYVTAASEFQRLVTDYPTHPLAPEARFGICESYVRLSPRPVLDQEYTLAAVTHCESVANLYPNTPQGEQARQYVAEGRSRLARKAYDNGMFYFRRRAFDAAVIYFTTVVEQYPDTTLAPAALLQLVETYTRIGYVEEATEARERLMREYPQSAEAQGLRA